MNKSFIITEETLNHDGFFGEFGGKEVDEKLDKALVELEKGFKHYIVDDDFKAQLLSYQKEFIGRESPLYHAKRLTKEVGGAQIYFKREDLNHTGSHKINNCLGQILLAYRMGKKRIIAETGAGQHGVAVATVCAHFGLECNVYMGAFDCQRQAVNVKKMQLLGAKVIPVENGSKTLKDAVDAALKDFADNADTSFYLLGSAVGPHPYPLMVRTFQSIIGKEARKQFLEKNNVLPDAVVAAVGGGSNAIGMFYAFIGDDKVKLYGVEPAGKGLDTAYHAASICKGKAGSLHGFRSMVLTDESGEASPVHSISAGLDYPSVGPEHAFLAASGRAKYVGITDKEAVDTFVRCSCAEGIIPALESAHAIAYALKLAKELSADKSIIVCLSGRGDKDLDQILAMLD